LCLLTSLLLPKGCPNITAQNEKSTQQVSRAAA